jgi:hypothetical protein
MPGIDINYDEARTRANALMSEVVTIATEASKASMGAEEFLRRGEVAKAREWQANADALRAELAGKDKSVLMARREYLERASAKIVRLRAEAEAKVDPATRTADELERARLTASPVSAEELARQAGLMLDAGQPRRAALLLAVARDKGAPTLMLDTLPQAVEEALDRDVSERKEAADIEAEVALGIAELDSNRLRLLAATGIGIDVATGSAGNGTAEQVSAARVGAKLATWQATTAAGKTYHPDDDDLAVVGGAPDESTPDFLGRSRRSVTA